MAFYSDYSGGSRNCSQLVLSECEGKAGSTGREGMQYPFWDMLGIPLLNVGIQFPKIIFPYYSFRLALQFLP